MGERKGSGKIFGDKGLQTSSTTSSSTSTLLPTRSGLEVDAFQWTSMLNDLDIQDMTMEGFEPRLPEDDFPDDITLTFDPFPAAETSAADQSLQLGFEPVNSTLDLLSATLHDDPVSTTFDLDGGQISSSSPEQSFSFGSVSTMDFEHGFMMPNTGKRRRVTLLICS